MEIQILRKQGKSLRQISLAVGVCVNTVRKYIAYEGRPFYRQRLSRPRKLDGYKAYLAARIAYARPLWLPAPVLLQEIREQGYRGGITQLKEYMRLFKDQKPEARVIRFETEPGQQMQVDWIEFEKYPTFLAAFVATLGFSRVAYVHFVNNERIETLLACHEQAFVYFGGVPQEVLYDNMKTVIIKRDAYGPGQHRFHGSLLDFAKTYGFQPKVCRPYRAQTKGKVERFNRYLRYSFYYPYKTLLAQAGLPLDIPKAQAAVMTWLREVANVRIHATLQVRPVDRLKEEQAFLQPLNSPYVGLVKPSVYVHEGLHRSLPSTAIYQGV